MLRKSKYLLLVIMFIILCQIVLAQTNETGDTTLTITSSAPTVSSVVVEDNVTSPSNEIDLYPADRKTINCSGVVSDADGYADIDNVSAWFHHTGVSANAADDDDNHYSANCTTFGGSGNNLNFQCLFHQVEFYIEPGIWQCNVTVNDTAGTNGTGNDSTLVNTLLAIDIPDATEIDFGSVGVGDVSENKSLLFENEGNADIDVDVDFYPDDDDVNNETAMTCTIGTIPIGNVNVSLDDTNINATLHKTGVINVNATLIEATGEDANPTNDTMYFLVKVPATGVSGTCDGTVYVGATAAG